MARRNHSRRAHEPFGKGPEFDRGSGFAARGEAGRERREGEPYGEETWDDREEMGMVGEVVAHYPYSTLLTGFGFGFGLGLAVTLLLTRREQSWFERYAPESIQHLPDRLHRVTEAVALRVPGSWRLG